MDTFTMSLAVLRCWSRFQETGTDKNLQSQCSTRRTARQNHLKIVARVCPNAAGPDRSAPGRFILAARLRSAVRAVCVRNARRGARAMRARVAWRGVRAVWAQDFALTLLLLLRSKRYIHYLHVIYNMWRIVTTFAHILSLKIKKNKKKSILLLFIITAVYLIH